MPRDVPEWIGETPDTPVPLRVRMRVYEARGGKCACCGVPIAGKPWEIDHSIPLIHGGKNRESNLQPLLTEHHRIKTHADVQTKARTARIKAAHLGVKAKGRPMPGSKASKFKRKINGQVVLRDGNDG
jgi:5-methylcytosine-specific restriction protein A